MAQDLNNKNIIIIIAIIISILVLGPYVGIHIANTSPAEIKAEIK